MRKTATTRTTLCRRIRHAPVLLLLGLLGGQSPVNAQLSPENLRLPISLEAKSTDYDGKTSMLMFRGLRLSQGSIGVEADEGRATKLDFEDSVWQFKGNVVIETESGRVECESADLRFTEHQLQLATISGSPATFELTRAESADVTYAEAGRLKYDFSQGVVEFSENATITEGGNQISSNYLVYDIRDQRIRAQAADADSERVKIIYTPQQLPGDVPDTATAPEAGTAPGDADSPAPDPQVHVDGEAPTVTRPDTTERSPEDPALPRGDGDTTR